MIWFIELALETLHSKSYLYQLKTENEMENIASLFYVSSSNISYKKIKYIVVLHQVQISNARLLINLILVKFVSQLFPMCPLNNAYKI